MACVCLQDLTLIFLCADTFIRFRQIVGGHSEIRLGLQEKRDEFRNEFKGLRALMFDRKT